jgi:CRISPR type III-B/RAMP module RAMP protein Cmr6
MPTATTHTISPAALTQSPAWHLRLDKFSGDLDGGAQKNRDAPPPKTTALRSAVSTYTSKAKPELATVIKAKLAWLDRTATQATATHHRAVRLVADSKLIVALGRAHVLQNVGLAFERTTGLPLIPGSAVKGVVSTWAAWSAAGDALFLDPPVIPASRADFTAEDTALARRILGDNATTGSASAGEVIFLGGFPESVPTLGLDIVNPHHESNGSDKRNLTPNVFLCLEPTPTTIWRFPILVRPGAEASAKLLEVAGDWLTSALTQTGIGAKTAAGYGRFRLLPDAARAAGLTSAGAPAAADYTEKTFVAVLERLNNAGAVQQFQADLKTLQLPQNAAWLAKLKAHLASPATKDVRKRLKDKAWFPKNLLPTP